MYTDKLWLDLWEAPELIRWMVILGMNSRLLKCLWAPRSYVLFVFLLFSNWLQTKFRPILRKQEVYKKHDYTVQITPAAVCLIYTLMISSPSDKSIAVYLWMCSFVWPKAAHVHQTSVFVSDNSNLPSALIHKCYLSVLPVSLRYR